MKLITLIAPMMLLLTAAPALAAGDPVAQVYLASGKAELRGSGSSSSRPLARGAVLSADDQIILRPGAEVGIYYRSGGRKLLRGGTKGVSGSVAGFAPPVEPYRGQSVSFGATRGSDVTEAVATPPSPPGIPIVASMPVLTFAMGPSPDAQALIASATIRVMIGETTIASASIERPTASVLRLDAPVARVGEEYSFEIVLLPAGAGESCAITGRFFIAAAPAKATGRSRPVQAASSVADFLTPFYFIQGQTELRIGDSARSLRYECELGEESGRPVLATIVTPDFAR